MTDRNKALSSKEGSQATCRTQASRLRRKRNAQRERSRKRQATAGCRDA